MEAKQTKTLRPFVDALEIGDPIGHQNLTLVPLRGGGHGRLDYLLAQEAISSGQLTVTEISEGGSVPELLAINSGEKMILLLDGEELVGAKQNRILNTSVLLPARSKTKIPVSCVEQGRWRHNSPDFKSGHHSPSSLRARKSRDVTRNLQTVGEARSNQGAVWDAVEENVVLYQAAAPTMAMSDVYEQRQNLFEAYVNALKYPADARGVVVAVGGKLVAVDLFDKPATLKSIWSRLVTGYAVDAAARAKKEGEKDKPFTAKGASTLMEHIGEIVCQPCPSVGIGEDWRFEAPDILGQALVVQEQCVHLSVFPNEFPGEDEGRGPGILPPSRRRANCGGRPGGEIVY
jgi:hypothetical protein